VVLSRTERGGPLKVTGIKVRACAKLNLGLEVLGPRHDGYHELRTIFQTIDLHDEMVLSRLPEGLEVLCDHPLVPRGPENLVHRAASDLARFAGVRQGAKIVLTKRIPVGGGLGGGSSDAAAALRGLDHLWGLGLGPCGLHPLARRLGADVPYFLTGGTALGIARGDEVYPLRWQARAHVVVVDPQRSVSTAAVFRRVAQSLTPRENSNTIFRFVSRDLEGDGYSLLANELEQAALEEAPELAERVGHIRGILVREGALMASLSGSGSAFFGLFAEAARARKASAVLENAGFSALRARTLSLEQYRRMWSRSLV
jgi:4-diphosphocytidyl-2-C-methyl-D-erythritol kinase